MLVKQIVPLSSMKKLYTSPLKKQNKIVGTLKYRYLFWILGLCWHMLIHSSLLPKLRKHPRWKKCILPWRWWKKLCIPLENHHPSPNDKQWTVPKLLFTTVTYGHCNRDKRKQRSGWWIIYITIDYIHHLQTSSKYYHLILAGQSVVV